MKKSGLMNLIGALIISVVFITSVILALVFAGVFKVQAEELVISSGSSTAIYDGKALKNSEYSLVSGTLEQGHKIQPEITGKQTTVGRSENHIKVKIVDAAGKDVTKQYKITYKPGTLTVLSRPIKLIADSELKKYDGEALTSYKYRFATTSLGLAAGHSIAEVVLEGSQTEVGESENSIVSVIIRNKKGEDVTRNYTVSTENGKLIVYGEETLVFASGSDFKEYDGTPLTYDYWQMLSGELLPGDEAVVTVSGSQTEVGESENHISVIIKRGKKDVTSQYKILCVPGILTVIAGDSPGDLPGVGGGGGGDLGGGFGPDGQDEAVYFVVTGSQNGTTYLKMESYGNFVGQKWEGAKAYTPLYNGGSAYYLTTYAVKDTIKNTAQMQIDPKMGIFALPYYASNEQAALLQTSDIKMVGSASAPYTAQYYAWSGSIPVSLSEDYAAYVLAYKNFVEQRYLDLYDKETKEYLENIISKQGWSLQTPDILNKVAAYIQNAATYNIEYDVSMDEEANGVIAFLEDYKEGVCRHFASAATLLYRALGIPARYTVGFVAKTVAGQEVEVTGMDAHAWVEVYLEDIGWVVIEVTPPFANPDMGVAPEMGGLNPGVNPSVTPSVTPSVMPSIMPSVLPSIMPSVLPSIMPSIMPSIVPSVIPSVEPSVIPSVEPSVEPSIEPSVTPSVEPEKGGELVFRSLDLEKTYDGEALAPLGDEWWLDEGDLLPGDEPVVTFTAAASQTEVGECANDFTVVIMRDGEDVSANYESISVIPGMLTVNPIYLMITAGSDDQVYNSLPLTCAEYRIDNPEELLEGDKVIALTEGEQTEVGVGENRISAVYLQREGEEMIPAVEESLGVFAVEYYVVVTYTGTLSVRDAEGLVLSGIIGGNWGADVNDTKEYFTLTTSTNKTAQNVYLKMQSYGAYQGQYWEEAENYVEREQITSSPAYALYDYTGAGKTEKTVRFTPKQGMYAEPYYGDDLGYLLSDVKAEGSTVVSYTLSYYAVDSLNVYANAKAEHLSWEDSYYAYVKSAYLGLGASADYFAQYVSENATLRTLFPAAGETKEAAATRIRNAIYMVPQVLKSAALYDQYYKTVCPELDREEDVARAFLETYKRGVGRHFASAATLVFRALGIPARYTLGFLAEEPVQGVPSTVTGSYAHAWVEVYLPSFGWVQVEVTGGNGAIPGSKPMEATLIPAFTEGLQAANLSGVVPKQQVTGFTYGDYYCEVEVTGTRMELGIGESEVVSVQVFHKQHPLDPVYVYTKDGGVIKGADKFAFTFQKGKVKMYLKELTFVSQGFTETYDGKTHNITVADCSLQESLPNGYRVEYAVTGAGYVNAGSGGASFTATVYMGNTECSDHFKINYSYGQIVINRRPIVITADSAYADYDPNIATPPLRCDTFTITGEGLAANHTPEVEIVGEVPRYEPGASGPNSIVTVEIKSGGTVVTDNYAITTVNGTLTVGMPGA